MYSENNGGFASGNSPPRGSAVSQDYIRYILDTYSQNLIKLSYTYVRNVCDAEDVAQDVFVALIKRGKPFENAEHEKAWLLRTTINKSKNYLRSARLKNAVSISGADFEAEETDSSDEKTQVMEAVLSLPEKYRTVIHLYYYNGYSINEIAAIVGKKPATVGTLLARGRGLLKNMMIGGFDEDEQVD
ncbi:MAG: sigma-70 family RNA polymerase sigma factor [Ruminococcus sp.]|nr:sigma-70 family RNA polymerase sigma factor [Ruminococcus sp.]MCM1382698.1 sigma-70 family RNA polymerase sigma factor [Muribaculaceae bacterium]MCM1478556.1 sigma-70 family RNA polymerase sigma factor [Muribaculaceae bacterium]